MAMTVGVWGVDHPHGGGHLKALESTPAVERMMFYDTDPAKARAACANSAKGSVVDSPDALLEPGAVDALVVLLTDREAGPATLRAVEAGVYVYGDKPGARTAAEMARIVEACDRTGAAYCPCYPYRVDPVVAEIGRLIDSGVLGDIWSFGALWLTSQVALRGPSAWLFHRETAAAGILSWLGCHWIDLIFHLLGPARSVTARIATLSGEDIDVEDTAVVTLELQSGAIGCLRAGYIHKPFLGYDDSDLSVSFEGSLGSLYWPVKGENGYRLRTGHPDYEGLARRWVRFERSSDPQSPGYSYAFLDAFLEAARNRAAPPATALDALRVLQVVEAARRSSDEGVRVEV